MNPEQWLSLKWNGGSTMSDRWLNQSKIIQPPYLFILTFLIISCYDIVIRMFSFIIHFPIYYCQLLLFLSMYYFKIIYNQLKPVVNYYIAPLQYM